MNRTIKKWIAHIGLILIVNGLTTPLIYQERDGPFLIVFGQGFLLWCGVWLILWFITWARDQLD